MLIAGSGYIRPGPVIGPEISGTGGVAAAVFRIRIRFRIRVREISRRRIGTPWGYYDNQNLEERMTANRYLNVMLTLIAVELGVIALSHTGVPVSAQQRATPVVITGVDRNVTVPITVRGVDLLDRKAYLPVGVYGQLEYPSDSTPFRLVDMRISAPIRIDGVVRVEADPPLKVQIPVVTSPRPGL